MRNKRIRWILCLLPVLLIPLALLAAAFCLPAQYGETYLGGLSVKWEALHRASSPKIVLVGGQRRSLRPPFRPAGAGAGGI